jgi:hypothetical protein
VTHPSTDAAVAADKEAFRVFLRDHNLPATAQRLAIADVVLGTDRHLSAEEVATELRSRGASAGTASWWSATSARGSSATKRRAACRTTNICSVRCVVA